MATPIIPEPAPSPQPLPAELEHILKEASDNNVGLLECFRNCLGGVVEDLRDSVRAIDQAEDRGLLTSQEHDDLLLDVRAFWVSIHARWPTE